MKESGTPEPKAVDPKAVDPKAAPKDPKAEPGKVPDKYEFKAPEGRELDAKAIEAATPIFKELGLTQDQAQKLIDLQVARDTEAATASEKLVSDTRAEWRDKVVKDPTLGDGKDNLRPEVKANIAKAMASLTPEMKTSFTEALDMTGAGDNPAIIAAMNAFGKMLSEGTAVRGGGPSPNGQHAPGTNVKPTPAQAMYPKLPSSASGS